MFAEVKPSVLLWTQWCEWIEVLLSKMEDGAACSMASPEELLKNQLDCT